MSRIAIACRANEDYTLWIRFGDGLEGRVFLGNLVDVGAFRAWRELAELLRAYVDVDRGTISWPSGVHLDAELMWMDVAARHDGTRRAPPAKRDPAFERFLQGLVRKPGGAHGR